jgi:deoxyribodipyrimidine photo-lyase
MPLPKPIISYAKTTTHDHCKILITQNNSHPWASKLLSHWEVGEQAAQKRLTFFIENQIQTYSLGRDYPSLHSTSRLSPYLHCGQLSPNQIFHAIHSMHLPEAQTEVFLRELGWREFSYYLLYHFPDLPEKNYKKSFDAFPWANESHQLNAWKSGKTGYPLIDAGMRELWQTGSMHNRVRMVTASFLIKNLRIDWRIGQAWFWNCLVDADLASNSASWQWVAGSGADAAPFFRIFNPVTQSKKFDADGNYIRHYIPELAKLDSKHIHDPSNAPSAILKQANVILNQNYPKAIVDLKATHAKALHIYQTCIRKNTDDPFQ